jgi:hypothetical protein
MYYTEFTKSIKRSDIVESVRSYLQLIERTEDDKILINGIETQFESLEEAKKYIKTQSYSAKLNDKISEETYEELSDIKVANIIKEYQDVKVTDTLIESYIELASSNIFTVDPVVYEIRKLNKLDVVIEGKIHYELNDGSVVAISEATQENLNNLLQNQKEIIDYMRESKENFIHVVEKLEE